MHRHEHIEYIRKSFTDNEFEDVALRPISAIGCDLGTDDPVNGFYVGQSGYLARAKVVGTAPNYGLYTRFARRKYELVGEYRGPRVPLIHAGIAATYHFQVESKLVCANKTSVVQFAKAKTCGCAVSKKKSIVIDASEMSRSSAMRFVNQANLCVHNNCVWFTFKTRIFLVTVRDVPPNTELLASYSAEDDVEAAIRDMHREVDVVLTSIYQQVTVVANDRTAVEAALSAAQAAEASYKAAAQNMRAAKDQYERMIQASNRRPFVNPPRYRKRSPSPLRYRKRSPSPPPVGNRRFSRSKSPSLGRRAASTHTHVGAASSVVT